jgi:hypothetical protein
MDESNHVTNHSHILPLCDAPREPKLKKGQRKPTKVQASEIQGLMHLRIVQLLEQSTGGQVLSEDVRDECNALSAAVRAWDTAADRARIARGKPLPGSMRPEKKASKKSKTPQAPSEPDGPTPQVVASELANESDVMSPKQNTMESGTS